MTPLESICQAIADENLTVRKVCILIGIEQGRRSHTQLARDTKVSGSAITGQIDDLERRRFIVQANPDASDRRIKSYLLTERGTLALARLKESLHPAP